MNHTTGTLVSTAAAMLTGNGTSVVNWDLCGITLPNGRYSAELPGPSGLDAVLLTETYASTFHVLAGDVNGDEAVNFADFSAVGAHFDPLAGTPFRPGDADGNGVVNFSDFVVVGANFNPVRLPPLELDFGDGPTAAQSGLARSYPTRLIDDGPRHILTGNTLLLGAARDAEDDGQPDRTANGDGADEDGVTIGILTTGTMPTVSLTSTGPGFVNAWVDFNRDGHWDAPGEQVLTNAAVVPGVNLLSISVPSTASPGTSFARFRLTSTPGYGFDGLATSGEAEDYQVTLAAPPAPPGSGPPVDTPGLPVSSADALPPPLLVELLLGAQGPFSSRSARGRFLLI
jgi:hypothetical protein